jgi:uncharacterized protein (DUF934 family)
MALLEHGRIAGEDQWVAVADDAAVPDGVPVLLSLARWRAERDALDGRNAPVGVRLRSDQTADDVAADLDRLSLVAVEFPKFRDGRGFSVARELRERYGYKGDIRAVGHVIADQHTFLLRCGFTSVVVPDGARLESWIEALDRITVAYQPDMISGEPVSLLRRHLAVRS